ncbi:kinase phosphorylation protein-domain-containing protein [Russula earlei]|uniref:Kinase phosphorylation protein-domain-containing protein n=1 Tax=Russula earlei TaxID=71964 RepID=A0ACC0UAS6_9AGAM|nr:kinase phosphorylation protein-domain-containing protein [Russula earlei]
MFEPIRGGTRGGQAEFKWSDVSADKDRENYLGHSINAPTGRWQKNKDVHWYNRDTTESQTERMEEIRKIKEAEAEALSVALGFGPSKKESSQSSSGTGTNAISIPPSAEVSDHVNPDKAVAAAEKAERRRRRVERREDKSARRAEKAAHRERRRAHMARHDDSPSRPRTPVRQQRDSRSPSPKHHRSRYMESRDDPQDERYQRSRKHHSPDRSRWRSPSPRVREARSPSEMRPRRPHPRSNYNDDDLEGERSRERQRWDYKVRS